MPYPGAAFLVGKILDAFLLDHIDYDLDRLRRFNALIDAVRDVRQRGAHQAVRRVVAVDARRSVSHRR